MYAPNFTITNPILQSISLIEAAKALIDSSPLLPSWEKRFQDEAVVRTVHHGTHLEGNELDFSQAKRVIEGEVISARSRDVQEVINYRNVIEFIGKVKHDLDEDLLKKLHAAITDKILPADEAGRYREKNVVIRNSRTGNITFRPPPAVEIPSQVRSFFNWLDSDQATHAVIRAGITHYELVRIHPFIDGNGRVARAATMLILFDAGYDIRRFFSLEEYYDRNAKDYYKALQSVGKKRWEVGSGKWETEVGSGIDESLKSKNQNISPQRSDQVGPNHTSHITHHTSHYNLTPWLEYFVQGLAIEFNRVKKKIAKISRDLNLKNALGGQIYLNDRQLKIIEHIQDFGFLQNKIFFRLFPDISEDTVLRELKELINKGIIAKKGKTKAARYVLA
jgi:Fic family protein